MTDTILPFLGLKAPAGEALAGTALVALQHLLPSIDGLFGRFVEAGFEPSNVFLIGKPYSTVPSVAHALRARGLQVFEDDGPRFQAGRYSEYFLELVERFWQHVEARLPSAVHSVVVLDEGGWLCRRMPESLAARRGVVAVEHTMHGLFGFPGDRTSPVVMMAASAAKTRFENRVIADSIVGRLAESVTDLIARHIGVIGLGNLGSAVAQHLDRLGAKHLQGFDRQAERGRQLAFLSRPRSLRELAEACEVLVGCTGRDAVEPGSVLQRLDGLRWLASGSSADIEFLAVATLLSRRSTLRQDPFADARGTVCETDVILLNGGFPLNFDRQREREDVVRIQLTRELTFASVLQAALCVDPAAGGVGIRLDAAVQQMLVERWLDQTPARNLFPNWSAHELDWWQKNSAGVSAQRSLADRLTLLR